MGMFSWNCKRCGHPLLGPHRVNSVNSWMNEVVYLSPGGTKVSGYYDGYGRIKLYGSGDLSHIPWEKDAPEVWHRACYTAAGEPEYSGPSENAEDQGHFFEEGAHDMEAPDG